MFPIRDHNPSLSTPFVTRALVLLNVLILLYQWSLSSDPNAEAQFYRAWAMFPVLVTQNGEWHGLVTSMFLHGGFWHLAGNMLFLWIFGDNLEDQMGHAGFLAFYLASGILAGLAQVAFEPLSRIPTVGASGAIAGVMGGYLLLFPRARVDVLFIFIIFFKIIPLPAFTMLGVWLLFQIWGGLADSGVGTDGGVAYWAHIGGFAAGAALTVPLWLRRGGTDFWSATRGLPPHAAAGGPSAIPVVRRRR